METLVMSRLERRRLEVMSRVGAEGLSLRKASELLEMSYRQVRRLWSRYQQEGDAGLVHKLRGRESNHRSESEFRERVISRYVERYHDYGPTLASESLAEEGVIVPVETLRRWLLAAGLWSRKRRRKEHRRRRARKEHFGEMVQMDGSHHDWFEGRRGWAVLMVIIDDATGHIYARFSEEETLSAALDITRRYALRQGLPQSIYVDRAGIYRSDREPTEAEILAGKEPKTQFGRAMESLGVRLILARSPQAKGRVERMNSTLQDRLVKALRQRGISDLESANRFLEEEFLEPFNAKFRVAPSQAVDLHRAIPQGTDLACVLAVHEDRVVQNDWTVRYENAFLQLSRESNLQPGDRVLVVEQLDGRLRLFAGDCELAWGPVRSEPRPQRRRASAGQPTKSSQGNKPAANHPWRGASRRVVESPAAAAGVGMVCSAPVAGAPCATQTIPTPLD
jgi:molybdenum-dependent DNA-binding transcriptional regulator ModE